MRLRLLNQDFSCYNGSNNKGGSITHEVEINLYYREHMEQVRMDVYELGKTEVILGMLWLIVHNPEINWEIGEVRMTGCSPICGQVPKKK